MREVIEATKAVEDEVVDKKPLEMTKKELKEFVKKLEKEIAADLQFEKGL